MGLKAGIWASRLGSGLQGWELGLEAKNWVSRLEFGPRDWNLRGGTEEKKKEEKEEKKMEKIPQKVRAAQRQ